MNGSLDQSIGNAEFTIPLGRAAKYGTLVVQSSKFSDTVHDHIYVYGLRQILNDAIADKTDDDDRPLSTAELVAKAQKRLDTLYSGELRVRAAAAEPVDPVDAEVWRMSKRVISAKMKEAPEYAKTKGEKDRVLATIIARGKVKTWDEAIAIYDKANPKVRAAATKIVKERMAVGDIGIDF